MQKKCLSSLNEEIDSAAEVDNGYFWKLVNRRRNSQSSAIGSEMKFGDTTYRDPDEMCMHLGNHYSTVYSEAEHEDIDKDHYINVKSQVQRFKARVLDKNYVPLITDHELSNVL